MAVLLSPGDTSLARGELEKMEGGRATVLVHQDGEKKEIQHFLLPNTFFGPI